VIVFRKLSISSQIALPDTLNPQDAEPPKQSSPAIFSVVEGSGKRRDAGVLQELALSETGLGAAEPCSYTRRRAGTDTGRLIYGTFNAGLYGNPARVALQYRCVRLCQRTKTKVAKNGRLHDSASCIAKKLFLPCSSV
jgi:hypothetical protein